MQSSPANVRTFASDGAYWRRFASCAPSLVTTWMSTGTLAAAADAKNAAPTTGAAITASADLGLMSHPFLEGRIGWPGTGLLASGPRISRLPSGAVASASGPVRDPRPVTVAGPRRLLTGLPLTTDRCERRDPTSPGRSRRPGKKKGGPEAASLATSDRKGPNYFFLVFFALHLDGAAAAVNTSPL